MQQYRKFTNIYKCTQATQIRHPLFNLQRHWVFLYIILPCIKAAQITYQKHCQWEKPRFVTLLVVLADKAKLPLYIILKRKTIPKGKLPEGVIFRCQDKGWASELMQDLLHVSVTDNLVLC